MNSDKNTTHPSIEQAVTDISAGHTFTWREEDNISIAPEEIRLIRDSLNMTQAEFSNLFHISLPTLRNWEQGRKKPNTLATIMLLMIKKNPESMQKEINEIIKFKV